MTLGPSHDAADIEMRPEPASEAGPSSPRPSMNGKPASTEASSSASAYTPIYTLQGHKRSVSALAISPNGRELASSGADGLVKVWALATGSLLATLDYAEAEDGAGEEYTSREENDVGSDARQRRKSEGKAASARRGEQQQQQQRDEPRRRIRGLNDVAWSRDGHYLVTGGDDKVVRVWDVKRRTLVRQLKGHTSFVFCVAFSPDGTLVFSGGFDETVRLWDLQRGTCHRTIAAHSDTVTGVACNRDGSILASCSYDGLIRLWDASTGQCLKTLVHGEATPIGHVVFSPNGFQLLATSLDGTIRLWDMANTRVLKTYTGHQNNKFALKAAFTAWATHRAREGRAKGQADHGANGETDGDAATSMVVAGSEDHRVYLWDLQTKKVAQTLHGHRDVVLSIATHERVPIIASASLDRDPCIKIWQATRSPKPV